MSSTETVVELEKRMFLLVGLFLNLLVLWVLAYPTIWKYTLATAFYSAYGLQFGMCRAEVLSLRVYGKEAARYTAAYVSHGNTVNDNT